MDLRERTAQALAEEGFTLDDYEPGAVLSFVDGSLFGDSDLLSDAKASIRMAEQYGETRCWIYVVPCEHGFTTRCPVEDRYIMECEGHESLDGAHMGETTYCDGSCNA